MKRDRFAGFSLFKKAFEATKHEIAISLQVLANRYMTKRRVKNTLLKIKK